MGKLSNVNISRLFLDIMHSYFSQSMRFTSPGGLVSGCAYAHLSPLHIPYVLPLKLQLLTNLFLAARVRYPRVKVVE